jgi:flagellar protein FlbD
LSLAGVFVFPAEQDAQVMIRLTRLNNRPLVVNSELIKFIENTPDTVITLVSGEKIVVLENAEEVIARIVEFRRRLRRPLAQIPALEDSAGQVAKGEKSETREGPQEPLEDDA